MLFPVRFCCAHIHQGTHARIRLHKVGLGGDRRLIDRRGDLRLSFFTNKVRVSLVTIPGPWLYFITHVVRLVQYRGNGNGRKRSRNIDIDAN